MKNNSLIAIALIAFLAMAWYRMVLLPAETENSAENLKIEARENAEKGSPELAVKFFDKLLDVKDTLEDRVELLGYYKKCLEEESIEFDDSDIQRFLSETMNLYSGDAEPYEMAMEYWKAAGNMSKCAEVMDTAVIHEAVSDLLRAEYDEIKYSYRVTNSRYGTPMQYSEGIIPMMNGEYWVCFDDRMSPLFERKFDEITICNDGYIGVRNGDTVKFLTAGGEVEKVLALGGNQLAGAYGNGYVPVVKDGKYAYMDSEGNRVLEGYDYAGVYCRKRTAVLSGGAWKVINTAGETVISGGAEIVLDESGRCAMAGRIIIKGDGGYTMYNIEGEQVAFIEAQQVESFGEDTLAAACRGGKWGYIDTEGNWVLEPMYEGARSFCNGYGAVCEEGKWGFIDRNGELAVECQFEDVSSFTRGGKCMVFQEGFWRILEFTCR